jgi:protein ImuB
LNRQRRTKSDGRASILATVATANGGPRIAAVSPAARRAGITPGLPLADARALAPDLHASETDPATDRRMLEWLADGCRRYTPWTALDDHGGDAGAGLWLDISGCAHLFGGEAALLEDLTGRLATLGFDARAAVADTPGAAWATARFADTRIVAPGTTHRALDSLPVAGLRLPAAVVEGLHRMGLRHIGDLAALPRAPLVARFGKPLLGRLDEALGRLREPLSPRRPVPPLHVRLAFAEPIATNEDITAATRRLLDQLCALMKDARQGARRLELTLYRTDDSHTGTTIGTGRPVNDRDHLERLFREKLDKLDSGFGVDVMVLAATAVGPFAPAQMDLDSRDHPRNEDVGRLIDRLGNRFGPARVVHLEARASHIPERACREISAFAPPASAVDGRAARPRPIHLLPWPEPIEVMAPVPDHPPLMFRWRRAQHRVSHADGPERIAPEWWIDGAPPPDEGVRDYYRVENPQGQRFWLYREGLYRPDTPPKWYLHGFFA